MTTATAKTTVAEYRSMIDSLSDAFASLRSAANTKERVSEADRVRRAATRLMGAVCPRAKEDDRLRAERLIDRTATWLINAEQDDSNRIRSVVAISGHRILY